MVHCNAGCGKEKWEEEPEVAGIAPDHLVYDKNSVWPSVQHELSHVSVK